MSANTAFNVFVNAVIRNQRIPFAIEAGQTVCDLRNGAKDGAYRPMQEDELR